MNPDQRLAQARERCANEWKRILENSPFLQAIRSREFDKRLYAIYMVETYHYTLHNARNQALVGVRSFDISPQYLNFCFHHAAEEAGHELMPIHDLKKMGFKVEIENLPQPLNATEILVGYLYWISSQGNPLQRLGYSFWAENCYEYINPTIQTIKEHLNLTDGEMTFFIAHSSIDEKHAEEVERMMLKQLSKPEDWDAAERVMVNSLRLTGRILDEVMDEYAVLVQGKPSRYTFLNP